jgi:hypothetical protein
MVRLMGRCVLYAGKYGIILPRVSGRFTVTSSIVKRVKCQEVVYNRCDVNFMKTFQQLGIPKGIMNYKATAGFIVQDKMQVTLKNVRVSRIYS